MQKIFKNNSCLYKLNLYICHVLIFKHNKMKQVTFKRIKELRQEFLNDTFAPDLPKRNKTHYEKWILKICNLLTDHRNFIVDKTNKCRTANHFPSNFNNVYDQEYDLEVLRDDIQRYAWKKDWTFSDHYQAELMRLNID